MRFSIWLPPGLNLAEAEAAVMGMFIEGRQHPIIVENKPIGSVSIHVTTCDFDPIARMSEIVGDVADTIHRLYDKAYEISCEAVGIPGAHCIRMAEVGLGG